MEVLTQGKEPANLDYLSLGGLSVIGLLILSGLIIVGNIGVRSVCHTRAARKILPKVQSLKATGVQIDPNNPRGVYLLLDKDGDNQADFAVKPKESIDFDKMNGQSGTQWMNKLSLSTFHELKRSQKE